MDAIKGITDTFGLTDSGAAKDSMGNAEDLTRDVMKRLEGIDLPDIEKMRIALEAPELVGLLEAEQLGPSELQEISTDPALKEKQMQALANLQERADQGLTAEDKMAMEDMLEQVGSQERSQRAAIESEMQRKGTADSGTSLMAKLQGSQGSANQARKRAMQMAAQGQQNRMSALQNMGQMAGGMDQADWQRQAAKASAADRIAQANAMNRQQVNASNLSSRQNIANLSANLANQQQMYNKGLYQQQFNNEMTKAGAMNQATGNLANMYAQQAGAQAGADASVMGTLGTIGAAAMMMSDVQVKTDIEDGSPSVRKMLDELDPYEYDYNNDVKELNPELEGRQLGVMAQDLEESNLGNEFVEEDMNGIKRVDYGKMGSTQLAALADLHHRLKRLESSLGEEDEEY